MECRKVVTSNNITHLLFVLDAYGLLVPGKFIIVAYGKQRMVVLTKSGIDTLLEHINEFEKVEVKFECDDELAELVRAQILQHV